MKKMLFLFACLGLVAEELPDMVITASRVEAHSGATAQNVEIISGEHLELSRYQTVTEALQNEPSITLRTSGPHDSSSGGISLRGMNVWHTKLLIDGVPFMDVSSVNQQPMFGNLMLTDVDHIEIMKGAVSLQGSSAMGGVVNIVTHRPDKDGIEARVAMEAGSHEHVGAGVVVLGKYDFFDFKAGAGYEHERGISAVRRDGNGSLNLDNDVFQNQSYFGRIGLQFTENLRLEVNGSYQDIDEEYDDGWWDGVYPDTDNVWVRRNQWTGRLEAKELFDGLLDTRFVYSYTSSKRIYRDIVDPWFFGLCKRYIGETHFVDWMTTLHFTEQYSLSLGLEYDEQRARVFDLQSSEIMKAIHRTRSAYAALQAEPMENLFISLNGRYTHHSEFGSEWTGDAAVKYYLEMTGTTFRAAVGKGYRAPSVYELYAPLTLGNQGNPDLEPEYSTTWEAGVDQEFFEKSLKFGVAYFENYVEDMIVAEWPTYEQIDGAVVNGIESYAEYKLNETLNLRLAYTWQNGRDRRPIGNKHIAYLPEHKISFDGTWFPISKVALNAGGAWTSHRWNGTGNVPRKKLDDFMLMHVAATYFITDNIECYFRIENIFNTNYVLADEFGTTYNTYGRTYYAGVVFTF